MRTWIHSLASVILAAVFYYFYKWNLLLLLAVLIGGILIDIDHYLWYIYQYKKWNILECYKYYSEQVDEVNFEKNKGILLIFHTSEFLLLAVAGAFYSKIILAFLVGLVVHSLLDMVFLYAVAKEFVANHSITAWIIKNLIVKKKDL